MPENTSSTAQAIIDNGYSVITHQFPPTNYPTYYDPVTKVTECDYGTECPCIGISPSIPAGSGGQTIVVSASEATTASAGIVKTCNTSTSQATSNTVSLVPTQYYVQSEVTRLENLISSAGGTQTTSSLWTATEDLGVAESASFTAGSSYILDVSEGEHTITAITSSGLVTGQNTKLTLYVGELSDLIIQDPITLKGDLQEYSMNVCTLYFLNGAVFLITDFAVPGFSVTVTSGAEAIGNARGSLQYALSSASHPAVNFDVTTNGEICVLSSATTNGEKTVIGNGYDRTTVSGTVTLGHACTFSGLAFKNTTIGGSAATFIDAKFDSCVHSNAVHIHGDAYITSLSGSGSVTLHPGANLHGPGVIDLSNKQHVCTLSASYDDSYDISGMTITNGSTTLQGGACIVSQGNTARFSDCCFSGCYAPSGTALEVAYHANVVLSNCAIVNNSGGKGTVNINGMGHADFVSCVISSNTCSTGGAIFNTAAASIYISFSDCVLNGTMQLNGGPSFVTFYGSNSWDFGNTKQNQPTTFRIVSGGTLNLTGNAGDNSGNIIVNSSGGIVVGYFDGNTWTPGGTATVINSAGTAVTIEGSGTTLKKDGTLS